MLELFRNNNFIYTLLLIPYAVLLRLLAIYFGADLTFDSRGAWTNWLFGEQIEQGVLMQILTILLIFLHAAMINRIVIRNRMTNEMTLFPGAFYILIVSFFPSYIGLTSLLIGNTFILILLDQLFISHKKTHSAERIFSVGFWYMCAVLTDGRFFLYLPFLVLGLSMLRTVRLLNWTQLLIGILTPLVMSMMIAVIRNEHPFAILSGLTSQLGVFDFKFEGNVINIAQLVFFGIWLLISLFQYNAFTVKKNIHAQKKIDLLFWLLLAALICVFFSSSLNQTDWIILSIPLSVLVAMTFLRIRAKLTTELIHFIMIIGLLGIQIFIFF